MIYTIIAALVLLCLGLVWSGRNRIRIEERKCQVLADKQQLLEQQLREAKAAAGQHGQMQAELWQSLNTIYLYASLAQEAQTTREIKEDLKSITKECEKALRRM